MAEKPEEAPGLDPFLLKALVCPACHAALSQVSDGLQCRNPDCRRRYPVREGIPVMLIDESEIIPPEEFRSAGLIDA